MERKLILGILLIQATLTGVLIEEGTYGDTYHAKSGYFACGARLQFESDQGHVDDIRQLSGNDLLQVRGMGHLARGRCRWVIWRLEGEQDVPQGLLRSLV